MQLNEFMQKFSHVGDEEFISEDGSKTIGFNIKDFPKALQNYTDVICKLQRDICAELMSRQWHNPACSDAMWAQGIRV